MATRNNHTLLWLTGAGVGGLAAYEWLYKPWAAQQTGSALPAGSTLPTYPSLPTPNYVSTPALTVTAPTTTPAPTVSSPPDLIPPPSISVGASTSIGPQYGGDVGAALARKPNWTPQYAQERLTALVNAVNNDKQQVAALRAGTANPNAAGIPAAQAAILANQQALAAATANYNAALAAGNTNDAAMWALQMQGHRSDIADITARIAAAQQPVNDTGGIAAWEGALAGHDTDFFNLTGRHLV